MRRGQVVEVWVAAVPVTWNVVPNGRDAIGHMAFEPAKTTFRTVVYREFTRDSPSRSRTRPATAASRGR